MNNINTMSSGCLKQINNSCMGDIIIIIICVCVCESSFVCV